MSRALSRSLALPLSMAALLAQQPPSEVAPAALQAIRAEALLAHARYLAADERGGRMTATPGQYEAAAYIVEHFRKLGLEPLGDLRPDGSRDYLQHYPLRSLAVGDETQLVFGGEVHRQGFGVLAGKDSARTVTIDGEWVLESWGTSRHAPRLDGKVPVLLLPESKSASLVLGMGGLRHSFRRLHERGAEAVVVCLLEEGGAWSGLMDLACASPGKPVPSTDVATVVDVGEVPVVITSARLSRSLLMGFGLTALDCEALRVVEPRARAAALAKARPVAGKLTLQLLDREGDATNVVAVLRGADPRLRSHAVLYTAPMDWLGARLDGMVCNGASSASGTAGLLAVAQAWAESPKPPARSIVFLVVSGEMLGSSGSQHFVEAPSWPLEQIVANIDTDRIGCSGAEAGADEVMVTPSYGYPAFSTLVRSSARCAARLGLRFVRGGYNARSDHFARRGIPVVSFDSPGLEDLTDTADNLDGDKMERIARLAFWTGWLAAQSPERPLTLGRSDGWLSDEDK